MTPLGRGRDRAEHGSGGAEVLGGAAYREIEHVVARGHDARDA